MDSPFSVSGFIEMKSRKVISKKVYSSLFIPSPLFSEVLLALITHAVPVVSNLIAAVRFRDSTKRAF
jgi:hypothetical protein